MTKIGEGSGVKKMTEADYQHALQESVVYFENALNGYQVASNDQERDRLDQVMHQQMQIINAAVKELKRSGVQKQGTLVRKDYETYLHDGTKENLTRLEQDLSTLKEYSGLQFPKKP
jgi:hypothetical protein